MNKKLIILLVVAFLLFFLITQPVQSAGVVGNTLGGLKAGAQAVVMFIKDLLG